MLHPSFNLLTLCASFQNHLIRFTKLDSDFDYNLPATPGFTKEALTKDMLSELAGLLRSYKSSVGGKFMNNAVLIGRNKCEEYTHDLCIKVTIDRENIVVNLHTFIKLLYCDECDSELGEDSFICGGCKKVRYCSEECQKAHWKDHKKKCCYKKKETKG